MKNSISSVARVGAGIAEMTGNIAQGVRRHASRWSAHADEPIPQNAPDSSKNRANGQPRRQPGLRRAAVSEHHARESEGAIEHRCGLEFDVRRFCSELEEWRAALASLPTEPCAIGYQSPAEQSAAAPNPHRSMVPYEASKSSGSLEANVADAVQRLEGGSIFGPLHSRSPRRAIA
ncbi:hypothetical protein [Hyphomicrobium facile]|uniref:Uncharacterized protein n=1 Tax=Hyphomicrobium facile TaxID=51670 RepID=A0A1I7NJ14_9HYPH|nr:hypothetical protein [Hyphomicrobium facile]SFV34645.1 hypothetical protein SAMN04488557_2389 [Hyphomicrobium facile]